MKEKKIVANRLVISYKKDKTVDETTIVRCSQGYVVIKEPDWFFFDREHLITYLICLLEDFDCVPEMEVLCL